MLVAMSRPFGQFSVALGELRAGLLAAAQRAGVSPSVLARQAIAAELARRNESVGARAAGAPASTHTLRRRRGAADLAVEVRVALPASDAERVTAAARRERMSRSEYLAVLVSGAFVAGSAAAIRSSGPAGDQGRWAASHGAGSGDLLPQVVKDLGGLRDALVASTVQVGAVGRNVNQIARSLNTTPGVLSQRDRGELARLARLIEAHVAAAGAVLLALRPVVRVRQAKGKQDAGRD
jgi:hypothetical protein